MRLKVFRGRTLAEAMEQVRAALGNNALILGTASTGGEAEVTAAIEQEDEPEPLPRFGFDHELDEQPTWFGAGPAGFEASAHPATTPFESRSDPLRWHNLPDTLRSRAEGSPERCARLFRFEPLPVGPNLPPLLLAGPPGAGKTLMVARLAARLVLEGQKPLVLTADDARAGAVEQLAAFTRLLGLTLVAAGRPDGIERALGRRGQDTPVLIDLPGLDLAEPSQAETLATLIKAARGRLALVLPTGLDPDEAADLAMQHGPFGARHLVPTRLEEGRRLGGILAAAEAGGLALAEGGSGTGVVGGLLAVTPELLAARLSRSGRRQQPRTAASASTEWLSPGSVTFERPPAERPRTLVRSALPLHIAAQRRTVSEDVP
jgi:flagellar biosynthesis protein FlhF